MTFDTKGREDIEAFAARMDAQLNIIGMPYNEDDDVINGNRAEYLFKALSPWLEQKIREQGQPPRCTHEQWCFGRVLEKARLILLAQAARPKEEYKGKKREEKKPFTSYKKDNRDSYKKEDKQPFGPKFKKLSEMTTEEKDKMRADNICFFCREKGHTIENYPKATKTRHISTIQEEDQVEYLSVIIEEAPKNAPAVKKIKPWATTPTKGSEHATGYDLYAIYTDYIRPGEQLGVNLGITIWCPQGTYGR